MQLALNNEIIPITESVLRKSVAFKNDLVSDFHHYYQNIASSDDIAPHLAKQMTDDDLLFLFFKSLLDAGEDLTSGEGLLTLIATLMTDERYSQVLDQSAGDDITYNVFVSKHSPMPILYLPKLMANVTVSAPSTELKFSVSTDGVVSIMKSLMAVNLFECSRSNHSMALFQMGKLSALSDMSAREQPEKAAYLGCAHLLMSIAKDELHQALYAFLNDQNLDVAIGLHDTSLAPSVDFNERGITEPMSSPSGTVH